MSPTSQPLQVWLLKGVLDCPLTCTVLLSFGLFTLARFALKTLSVFAQTFVLPGKNLKTFGAKNGAWAVVTGASDGIGKEFALQLAAAGFNVLLVARNNQMLTEVAADIATKTAGKVETKIQLVDFAKNDPAALKEFQTLLASLDVGVLVNNVGKSHYMPTYFAETIEQENEDIVTINVNGTLRATHAVLPGMIQQKRGLILNVGSFAGEIPSPMLATYSGTKAFVATFTDALAEEVKAHNITVQHLNTYFVVSKMSNIRKASTMIPLPSTYVRSVLSKVGLSCGAVMTERPSTLTPFWSHALLDYLIHVIGWKAQFISYTHSLHKDIRRRALRKLEREAKKQ